MTVAFKYILAYQVCSALLQRDHRCCLGFQKQKHQNHLLLQIQSLKKNESKRDHFSSLSSKFHLTKSALQFMNQSCIIKGFANFLHSHNFVTYQFPFTQMKVVSAKFHGSWTWAHGHSWLASVAVTDRGREHAFIEREQSQFCSLVYHGWL